MFLHLLKMANVVSLVTCVSFLERNDYGNSRTR